MPAQKVKVRIAVAIDHEGHWHAVGAPRRPPFDEKWVMSAARCGRCSPVPSSIVWVEARIPMPDEPVAPTVKGRLV